MQYALSDLEWSYIGKKYVGIHFTSIKSLFSSNSYLYIFQLPVTYFLLKS